MAKKYRPKITLYFLEGLVATDEEFEDSNQFQPGVQFRSVGHVSDDAAIEAFDRLAGKPPARYLAVEAARQGAVAPAVDASGADGADLKPGEGIGQVKPPTPPAANAAWGRNA